jgi:SPP1 family predicted phage head-tail adaptor
MDPGELRELATVQELPTAARDAGGGVSNSAEGDWSDLATDPTVWVRLRPVNASTRRLAMQQGAPVSHEITMRYRSDVDSTMRLVVDGSRTFKLRGAGVNLDGRDEYLRFEAVEDGD